MTHPTTLTPEKLLLAEKAKEMESRQAEWYAWRFEPL